MIRSSETNRPQVWEDEAPAENRYRRAQPGVSLPGMPPEVRDPEDDELPRPRSAPHHSTRFDAPRSHWWWPASSWGKGFLALGALILLGGLAVSGVLLKTYLERDGRFRISGADNIEATGLTQVSRAEMLPVFGEDIGRNIFFVPLSERRRQLEQIPWIERATVMRVLPDQIRVSVVERKPVAFVRQGQQIGLVDADGILLSMPPAMMAQRHYSFPVVTGIDPADPPAARKERMTVYARLISELDANNQHFSEQISEIDLTDPEDARVLMPEQGTDILAHLGEDHFIERYQRYKAHIVEWRQQYPKLASVDLRYDQQVVLEMTPGANRNENAGGSKAPDGQAPSNPDQAKAPAAEETKAAPADETKKAPPRQGSKTKPQKSVAKAAAAGKPGAKTKPKVKSTSTRDDKKHAAVGQAALVVNQKKKTHPSEAGQGQ